MTSDSDTMNNTTTLDGDIMNNNDNDTKNTTKFVNLSDLMRDPKFVSAYEDNKDYYKISDMLNRMIVITGYSEDTIKDAFSNKDKPCFRMDFYFVDDIGQTPHYTKSEANRLWGHLRAIDRVDPELIPSGTIRTMISQSNGKGKLSGYYYFAGTEPSE